MCVRVCVCRCFGEFLVRQSECLDVGSDSSEYAVMM